jgi:hypothetical protein
MKTQPTLVTQNPTGSAFSAYGTQYFTAPGLPSNPISRQGSTNNLYALSMQNLNKIGGV